LTLSALFLKGHNFNHSYSGSTLCQMMRISDLHPRRLGALCVDSLLLRSDIANRLNTHQQHNLLSVTSGLATVLHHYTTQQLRGLRLCWADRNCLPEVRCMGLGCERFLKVGFGIMSASLLLFRSVKILSSKG